MTYIGKESKKEWVYVYVQPKNFVGEQKLTQHYKSTIPQ